MRGHGLGEQAVSAERFACDMLQQMHRGPIMASGLRKIGVVTRKAVRIRQGLISPCDASLEIYNIIP